MQAIVLTHHAPTDRNALVSWERDESDEDVRCPYVCVCVCVCAINGVGKALSSFPT